jgi:hypothetical protein
MLLIVDKYHAHELINPTLVGQLSRLYYECDKPRRDFQGRLMARQSKY